MTQPDSPADPAPQGDTSAAAPKAPRRGTTGHAFVLGVALGLGGAALGYGAALQFPLQPPAPAAVVDLAPLTARIAALESAPPASDDVAAQLQALAAKLQDERAAQTAAIDALTARLDGIDQRLAEQPAGDDLRAELRALRAELAQNDPKPAIRAALAAELAQVQGTAQRLSADLAASAAQAQRQASLLLLRAALDSGAPFAAAAKGLTLPQPLADAAQSGVPSLAALTDSFDAAARAALDAALRADLGQGWAQRVQNFLRAQTGARALTPRAGDDPDAILSRMAASLRAGDLAAVQQGLASLPPAAQTAMADWAAALQSRLDALAAYQALARAPAP